MNYKYNNNPSLNLGPFSIDYGQWADHPLTFDQCSFGKGCGNTLLSIFLVRPLKIFIEIIHTSNENNIYTNLYFNV